MLENTPLVLTAFYVNISIQFTLVELHGCCVGFGWTRLLLCLLNAPWITSLSVITENIPSSLITMHLISGHHSFFLFRLSYILCFSLSIICRAETTQPYDFWPWHYKGQLSEMTRPHEWYSKEESVLDHHSKSSNL